MPLSGVMPTSGRSVSSRNIGEEIDDRCGLLYEVARSVTIPLMSGYGASVESIDDGTVAEPGPVVVEFRSARTGLRQQFAFDEFTGGHLLHLAVAGCVYNDLWREAAARGIQLTHVRVSADGSFGGEPCTSNGMTYRVHVEGNAPESDLRALVAYVEEIAEIPSVIRLGAKVRMGGSDVISDET
jgi:putative redox protein